MNFTSIIFREGKDYFELGQNEKPQKFRIDNKISIDYGLKFGRQELLCDLSGRTFLLWNKDKYEEVKGLSILDSLALHHISEDSIFYSAKKGRDIQLCQLRIKKNGQLIYDNNPVSINQGTREFSVTFDKRNNYYIIIDNKIYYCNINDDKKKEIIISGNESEIPCCLDLFKNQLAVGFKSGLIYILNVKEGSKKEAVFKVEESPDFVRIGDGFIHAGKIQKDELHMWEWLSSGSAANKYPLIPSRDYTHPLLSSRLYNIVCSRDYLFHFIGSEIEKVNFVDKDCECINKINEEKLGKDVINKSIVLKNQLSQIDAIKKYTEEIFENLDINCWDKKVNGFVKLVRAKEIVDNNSFDFDFRQQYLIQLSETSNFSSSNNRRIYEEKYDKNKFFEHLEDKKSGYDEINIIEAMETQFISITNTDVFKSIGFTLEYGENKTQKYFFSFLLNPKLFYSTLTENLNSLKLFKCLSNIYDSKTVLSFMLQTYVRTIKKRWENVKDFNTQSLSKIEDLKNIIGHSYRKSTPKRKYF